MRDIKYLSPTSVGLWIESRDKFYLRYLADNRPPYDPQTRPMSIGSAFDAYVKSYLHSKLFGSTHRDSNRFGFNALFEMQVEECNRDWARKHGMYAYQCYRESGALADLLSNLMDAQSDPRFEFEVQGAVNGYREGKSINIPDGVTLLGKPDAAYVNRAGAHIILDWKVNGYCSSYPKSPVPYYAQLRHSDGVMKGQHNKATLETIGGMRVNTAKTLEELEINWARQLSIYAWLCGEKIGGDFVVAVDQLACSPCKAGSDLPSIRIAEHRNRISETYQKGLYDTIEDIWSTIKSGHIFSELTLEDSNGKCQLLEQQALELYGDNADPLFTEMTRR